MLPPTIIIRHRKENLEKCSLRGVGRRVEVDMHVYPLQRPLPDLSGFVYLTLDGPALSGDDAGRGLVMIDATWRLASRMAGALADVLSHTEPRSIPPGFVTAYPRRQTACPDPHRGLASIEAMYVAYHLTGRPTQGLLDGYRWAERFLDDNAALLAARGKRGQAPRGSSV